MEDKTVIISHEEKAKFARGVHDGKLYIVDYDPTWPKKAEEVMKELAIIFHDAVLIKHVGSTSIVGMPAKPVLDIMVAIPDMDTISNYQDAIETMGLKPYGALGPELCAFYKEDPVTGHSIIHVHVCKSGSKAQSFLADLSDYCNAIPEARDAYALLKKALILRYKDRPEKYGPAKAQFILDLAADAEEWKNQQSNK